MKNFRDYLAESERTYNYRIKIVGDMPAGFYDRLKDKLEQFDPVSIAAVKSTPIQVKPADFPAFENEKVNHFDVKLRYPAIEPQIKQIAQLMGLDPNKIIMQNTYYDDMADIEKAKVETENKNLLSDTDYPAPDKLQQELSQDYSADPYDHEVLKNSYRSNFKIAGGSPPKAKTTNELPMGKDSPMTHAEKRPRRPATGAQPRG